MAKKTGQGKGQVTAKERFQGFMVHAFTASGALLGFLALLAALEGRYGVMFAWLAAALVVDAIDGTFARKADVKRTAPEFSGETLDLVVDYVTYVLVPALAMYRAGLLPEAVSLAVTGMILISAALYFADIRMKTGDWYFRGFPAVWNMFAFLAFVFRPDPWMLAAIVVAFCALTFAPIAFVHPMRVARLRLLNLVMLGAVAVLCAGAIWWELDPPLPVKLGLAGTGLYFLLIGILRSRTE
jgi:phosphatidylcholine synthase